MVKKNQNITFTDTELMVLRRALVTARPRTFTDDDTTLISLMDKVDVCISKFSVRDKTLLRLNGHSM